MQAYQFTEDFGKDRAGALQAALAFGRCEGVLHADILPPKYEMRGWTVRAIVEGRIVADGFREVIIPSGFKFSCRIA